MTRQGIFARGSTLWCNVSALLIFASAGLSWSQSPPPNDHCTSATVIPSNTVTFIPFPYDTTTATVDNSCQEPIESCGAASSNTVWYSFTPQYSGSLSLNTAGSDYPTVLAVFDARSYGCGML